MAFADPDFDGDYDKLEMMIQKKKKEKKENKKVNFG
jgi:hypothetical protein